MLQDVAQVRTVHVSERHVAALRVWSRRLVPVQEPDDVGVAKLGEDGHLPRGRGALGLALDGDALDRDEVARHPGAAKEDLAEGAAAEDADALVVFVCVWGPAGTEEGLVSN